MGAPWFKRRGRSIVPKPLHAVEQTVAASRVSCQRGYAGAEQPSSVGRAARRADTFDMPMRLRFGGLIAIVSVAICVCALEAADAGDDPSSRLAEKIMSTSHPDSTAVLVLFDEDLVQGLRSRLPQPFKVVPFRHP